jgi:hypothetical protein
MDADFNSKTVFYMYSRRKLAKHQVNGEKGIIISMDSYAAIGFILELLNQVRHATPVVRIELFLYLFLTLISEYSRDFNADTTKTLL